MPSRIILCLTFQEMLILQGFEPGGWHHRSWGVGQCSGLQTFFVSEKHPQHICICVYLALPLLVDPQNIWEVAPGQLALGLSCLSDVEEMRHDGECLLRTPFRQWRHRGPRIFLYMASPASHPGPTPGSGFATCPPGALEKWDDSPWNKVSSEMSQLTFGLGHQGCCGAEGPIHTDHTPHSVNDAPWSCVGNGPAMHSIHVANKHALGVSGEPGTAGSWGFVQLGTSRHWLFSLISVSLFAKGDSNSTN